MNNILRNRKPPGNLKKKVVLVQGGFPAVSATFILDQMVGLIKGGLEIENWATYNPNDTTVHPEVYEHKLLAKTKYLKFPPEQLRRDRNLWARTFLSINTVENLDEIDAFHIHYGANFNKLEPLLTALDKFVIVSFHGYDASRYFRQNGDNCYTTLFSRADLITTPSFHMKNELVKRGCEAEKVIIHRYGIDLDRFGDQGRIYEKDKVIFLTVGRFVEKKGIEDSLLAFSKIADRLDCEYRIIGEGDLFSRYKKIVDSTGISSKVEFLGPQPKERVVAEMQKADVFVLTSVTAADGDCEGVPVALTEAHAAGLPVVSTAHSGIPELVIDNQTGLLTAERDIESIAGNMFKLANDADLRKSFSRSATERVAREFDIKILNKKLAGYFAEGRGPSSEEPLRIALAKKGWGSKLALYSECYQEMAFLRRIEKPTISVIVIAWRLIPDIQESLRRLEKQRDQDFELIFVNNGAAFEEFDALEPYIDTYIKLNKNTGAYLSRNIGALFAEAPILFFLDDDALPAPDLVKAHIQNFKRYDIVACRGAVLPNTDNKLNDLAGHYYLGDRAFPLYADVEGNTAYDAELFFNAGGWDDAIKFGGGGVELSLRLSKIEPDLRKQIYSPAPVIYHDYAADQEHLQGKRAKQKKSRIYLRKKHPDWDKYITDYDMYRDSEPIKNTRREPEQRSPKITICIPTYNRSAYLKEAIQSALKQTCKEFELLIIDDGSEDDTHQVVASYDDRRIRYLRNETNQGRPITRNRAIHEARTEYILWLDDDDILTPTIVEEYAGLLAQNPEIDIIYCNLQLFEDDIGQNRGLIEAKDWSTTSNGLLGSLVNGVGITNLGSCVRKSMYTQVGLYDELFVRAQDYEFWSRAAHAARFYKVNSVLARCRQHSGNISLGPNVDQSYESLVIRKIAGDNHLETIFPDLDWSDPKIARCEALYALAHNLMRVQDPYNAVRVLVAILKDSFHPKSLQGLVRCYLILGRPDEARAWLDRYERDCRSTGNLYKDLKEIITVYSAAIRELEQCLANQQYERADRVLDRLYGEYGPVYTAEILTAEHLEKADKRLLARKHYEAALQIRPAESLFEKIVALTDSDADTERIRGRYSRTTAAIDLFPQDVPVRPDGLVSVIIPTYNRPAMLREALTSVIQQTYKHFEIIVVNDAGEDVEDIVAEFKAAGDIRYFTLPGNKGMAAARNRGIEAARGKYIALLDDDDLFYPNHLQTALAHLNDKTPVVYTDAMRATYHNANGVYQLAGKKVPYSIDFDQDKLYIGNISPVNCFVFAKDSAVQAGLFDETFPVLEDWEFFIRLARQCPFRHIARVTTQVNWRSDGTSVTSARGTEFKTYRDKIYTRYRREIDRIADPRTIHQVFQDIWRADNQPGGSLISIVILAHNQLDYTRKCIESIITHTREFFEIIVVDNGSTDDTSRYLETELAGLISADTLKIISNDSNLGYAGGNNRGMAAASGEYILLLNNDVVVTPGWLTRLLACMEKHADIGIVGPMTNHVAGPQLVKPVAYDIDSLEGLEEFAGAYTRKHAGRFKRLARVVGFCMLIKREVIDAIGGLDERYGLGNFEDDDFSLRAVMAGYGSCIAKDCFIHHFGNRTFVGAHIDYDKSLHKNWEIFKEKWGLPMTLPYGGSWEIKDVVQGGFEGTRHFVPIGKPEVSDRPTAAHWKTDKQGLQPTVEISEDNQHEGRLERTEAISAPPQTKGDTFMTHSNQPVHSPETEAALIAYMEEKLQFPVSAAVIHNDLGLMYCRTGDNSKAREHFLAAADLDPANGLYLKNLADFYYSILKDNRASLAVYKKLVTLDPVDITVLTILGHIHLAEKEIGEAKTYYQRILDLDPANTEIRRHLENLASVGGAAETAEQTDSPDEVYKQAQKLVEQGDAAAACRQLESLVAAYPEYALAHNDLGVLYYQTGSRDKSLVAYERAVALEPENLTFKKNLADFKCVELKQIEAALEIYNEILAVQPDDLETLLAMGQVCILLGQKEDACHFLDQALTIEPWNLEIKQLLEDVEAGKQPSEAEHSVAERYAQATELAENGEVAEALATLTDLAAANPELAVVHNDLGVLYYQTGDMQAAAGHYEKAVEIEPDNTVFRKNLADFYCIAQGRLEEGMQIYVDLLAQEPDDVEVLTALGQICERLAKIDDALNFYEMALNVEPWNPEIRQHVEAIKPAGKNQLEPAGSF